MSASSLDLPALSQTIKDWGRELGFQQVGIAGLDLASHEAHLERWLAAGYHGEMDYMAAHGSKRSHPEELVPGTLRVISLRMDYLPGDTQMSKRLGEPEKAYVSRYALGRDYHKLIRKRIQQLAERIQQAIGPFGYRAFVDSAPVLEKAIAELTASNSAAKPATPKPNTAKDAGLMLPTSRRMTRSGGTCASCSTGGRPNAIINVRPRPSPNNTGHKLAAGNATCTSPPNRATNTWCTANPSATPSALATTPTARNSSA